MIRLLPLLLLVSACMPAATVAPPTADAVTLSGTVTYRQRIALPPDAVATVSLQDDAGGTIAETRVPADGRQVPLPFSLQVDRARIVAGADYRLHAKIRGGGCVLFETSPPAFERGITAPRRASRRSAAPAPRRSATLTFVSPAGDRLTFERGE